jgi:hypothetical protein
VAHPLRVLSSGHALALGFEVAKALAGEPRTA